MNANAPIPEPRISPIPFEDWDDETRTLLLAHLRRPELYLSGEPDALPIPKLLGLFARHSRLAKAWLSFNDVLFDDATLDARIRELIVLRVAWRVRSEYEWVQHVRIGTHAGLSVEQLYAIPEGSTASVWTDSERALLTATDQLMDDHSVDDATWAQLAESFDAAQLIEVLFIVGAYACLAGVISGVGLAADPPTEPIDAPPFRAA
jgi:alkylhydroperoxidase family enzyme